MASISTEPNGRRRINWNDTVGKQKVVRLGEVDAKTAVGVKLHVERLIVAVASNQPVAVDTAHWLTRIDDTLHARIARAGLTAPRAAAAKLTLEKLVDDFSARRTDVKPQTKAVWRQARNHLIGCFGDGHDAAAINPANADDFRRHVRGLYSEAYTAKMIRVCKAVFRDAARRKLIDASPFVDTRTGSQRNESRRRFIDRETIDKVIAAAPDARWRLIIALARYAGLRMPSELAGLRWDDVLWHEGRMMIRSPKTAHHEGHASRVVPIFPELLRPLREAFELADEGATHVVPLASSATQNLRMQFQRIIARAGVTPWPKLFQNLRASRATELADEYPSHVAAAWLGHAEAIADAHYRSVTDAHFARAATTPTKASRNPSQKASEIPRNGMSSFRDGFGNRSDFPKDSEHCIAVLADLVGHEGFEQTHEKQGFAGQWWSG